MEIQVKVLNEYTKEINELRREAYYQNHPDIEAKDEFDDISKFICIFDRDTLIACTRYTGMTPSVLQKWTSNDIALPSGNEYCNLTRSAIKKEYRGGHYFTLLIFEDLICCFENKKNQVMTIVEAERKRVVFLERLGWELYLGEVLAYQPPDGMTLGRLMIFDVRKNLNVLLEKREHLLNKMNVQGITVKSEIFDEFKK